MINKIKLNSVYDNKKTFIYIAQKEDTVQSLAERFHTTQEVIISLNGLTEDISKGEYLVIACRSFDGGLEKAYSNITIKKIPQMLLSRCEFGKTDYNLNIVRPPVYEDEWGEEDCNE